MGRRLAMSDRIQHDLVGGGGGGANFFRDPYLNIFSGK